MLDYYLIWSYTFIFPLSEEKKTTSFVGGSCIHLPLVPYRNSNVFRRGAWMPSRLKFGLCPFFGSCPFSPNPSFYTPLWNPVNKNLQMVFLLCRRAFWQALLIESTSRKQEGQRRETMDFLLFACCSCPRCPSNCPSPWQQQLGLLGFFWHSRSQPHKAPSNTPALDR